MPDLAIPDDLKLLRYYDSARKARYQAYKKSRPELGWQDSVILVNIGLDRPFYTEPVLAQNQHAVDVLVNKYNRLSADFIPRDLADIPARYAAGRQQLTARARDAFLAMSDAAATEGLTLKALSTYRSLATQKAMWQNKLDSGRSIEDVDAWNARSGHSEHHLGLAVDINSGHPPDWEAGGEHYKAACWLQEKAHLFGFILRYPKGRTAITGYQHEAWHFRYLSPDLAGRVKESGLTYDEFYERYLRGLPHWQE